jgi:hypothetical protein
MNYNYIISEINLSIANLERLKREVEQMQREGQGQPEQPAQGQQAFPPAPAPSTIADPFAKSMSDLVTPKQLGMVRALARERGVDHDEECQAVFKCKTDELSKRAASSFIDHLKELQPEFNARRAS